MLPEWLTLLPAWLLYGVAVGAVASVFVAGVFVVGGRLYPTAPIDDTQRIDGTTRRRAEIREYLLAIDERFLEDHEVHGDSVAFYLPDHDVAITFDAHAYFRIGHTETVAVLCEHEMPGQHLGRRLPFEVPDLDLDPETPDPVRDAYAVLGLPSTADAEAVKTAYRGQVKEAHPDHGGDPDEFKQLREAYTTARDHADQRPPTVSVGSD